MIGNDPIRFAAILLPTLSVVTGQGDAAAGRGKRTAPASRPRARSVLEFFDVHHVRLVICKGDIELSK
jgi:hypothetical protein